jgi:uncharacterized membrane protein YphA (DoxX/SURF4 family)
VLRNKWLAILLGAVGVVCIAVGAIFIAQGFSKNALLTNAMVSENITYTGAGGTITGIIDTPAEAKAMAEILAEHRQAMGSYTSFKNGDPTRQTILNAMTMENALNMAEMGFGLVQVVEATGAFMIVIGVTLGIVGLVVLRSRRDTA